MRAPHVSPDPRAVAIALFVVILALIAVVLYLAAAYKRVEQRAEQADAYELEAGQWRASYYAMREVRDVLVLRNSQLTSALELTTDVVSGVVADLSATCTDDQIIARAEFLAGQADLPADDVQRFVDDVERHANTRDNH